MKRQRTIRTTAQTDQQIAYLVARWGLSPERNLSAVVERAVRESFEAEVCLEAVEIEQCDGATP